MKLDITHCCQIKARQWDAFSLTAIVSLFPCLCLFLSLSLSLPPPYPTGIKIQFSEPAKFFVTQTAGIKPKYVIKDTTLFLLACLLEPESLIAINKRLQGGGSLQFPFIRDTVKSFS